MTRIKEINSDTKSSLKAMAKARQEGRKGIRFSPDPGTLASLSFAKGRKYFTVYGLVINESLKGCAVILMTDEKMEKDMVCLTRVGQLPETVSNVRWVKVLDTNLYKVGLEYDL